MVEENKLPLSLLILQTLLHFSILFTATLIGRVSYIPHLHFALPSLSWTPSNLDFIPSPCREVTNISKGAASVLVTCKQQHLTKSDAPSSLKCFLHLTSRAPLY